MNSEAMSGFVPRHWRLLTPAAKSLRTRRESEPARSGDRACRRGRMPDARMTPVGSIMTRYGTMLPPPTPNAIPIGLVEVDDPPQAESPAISGAKMAILVTRGAYGACDPVSPDSLALTQSSGVISEHWPRRAAASSPLCCDGRSKPGGNRDEGAAA